MWGGLLTMAAVATTSAGNTCSSCAEWCSSDCSFAPPPGSAPVPGKPGVSRMTVFRMTPVNDTNLLNKDTGDAAGDIAFTLMEMSMPMFCRHDSASSDCKATHGWLMRNNLVYAEHTIEASVWGPYMPCNIDPKDPNGAFRCMGARAPIELKDIGVCETCNRTSRHAGWYPLSEMGSPPPPPPLPTRCAKLANATCAAAAALGRGHCEKCIDGSAARYVNCSAALSPEKTVAAMKRGFCPPFQNVSKACEAMAVELCGPEERRWADEKNCTKCAEANAAKLFAAGCPTDAEPEYTYPIQLCVKPARKESGDKWKADVALMATVAGGLWLSTPTAGICPGGAAIGSDNCTWRDVGTTKIANFSCVNAGLNRAIQAKNASCFSQCPDGDQPYPRNATDCWLQCYYRVVSGGTYGQYGNGTISQAEMVAAWDRGFKSIDPNTGGCPNVRPPHQDPHPWPPGSPPTRPAGG